MVKKNWGLVLHHLLLFIGSQTPQKRGTFKRNEEEIGSSTFMVDKKIKATLSSVMIESL